MGMGAGELRQLVVDWLDDNFHFGEADELITDEEMSFLDNGILTSLGFVQLILFLEDRLVIVVDRATLTREDWTPRSRVRASRRLSAEPWRASSSKSTG